jgi:hypothetical protein
MKSPTFISLNFSNIIPHSNPLTTSFASSLNLLSDEILPVYVTTPSLMILACPPLITLPSVTKHPATVPTFGTTNVSLTSV